MSAFSFVCHESYPEEEYTKESVTLCIEGKHRVTYVRKKTSKGGLYWDVISAGVTQNGEKKFLKSYSQDSNFLEEDIKNFLNNRSWETKSHYASGGSGEQKTSNDELPF